MSARAACALCCLALALPTANAQYAGSAEGSVVNSATHSGIAGVTVKLFTRQGVRFETTTDGMGRFSVQGMKEDEYDSSFEREGFAPLGSIISRRLHVGGKNPARLDVELTPYAKIRGQVMDPEGKPAPNATVTLGGRPFIAQTPHWNCLSTAGPNDGRDSLQGRPQDNLEPASFGRPALEA